MPCVAGVAKPDIAELKLPMVDIGAFRAAFFGIVVTAPCFNHDLSLLQRVDDLSV